MGKTWGVYHVACNKKERKDPALSERAGLLREEQSAGGLEDADVLVRIDEAKEESVPQSSSM